MSKKQIEECVRSSLEGYFRDLRGTELAIAEIVREDEDDVRLLLRDLSRSRRNTEQQRRRHRGEAEGTEQTWVLLPDSASAIMQAEELSQREKRLRVRIYREVTGEPPVLTHDLPPKR